MIREVITIDENLCDGCNKCVQACAEGALQLIDGKARLINEIFCDGLGACIGECPQNAITVEKKEAEPYNEALVIERMIELGENTVTAHLVHLYEHGQMNYLNQALDVLKQRNIPINFAEIRKSSHKERPVSIAELAEEETPAAGRSNIRLQQWPVQLHLLSPFAAQVQNNDLLLTADCVPLAYPNFHADFLHKKALAIACPKLDSNKEAYLNKLETMIRESGLKSITVLIMQVPCCSGLVQLAKRAIDSSGKNIPLYAKVISIDGEVIDEFSSLTIEGL
jgi:NAD-dependent dihydropyrimidine dehydrogenase PreA subunit